MPAHRAARVTVELSDGRLLEHAFADEPNPVFRVVARCPDRCFARVRVDGKEVD